MKPADRQEFFRRLRGANPVPRTELAYSTPFELLVAVILSAQATDRSVNGATRVLFAKANTPRAMLALGVDGLADCTYGFRVRSIDETMTRSTCEEIVP